MSDDRVDGWMESPDGACMARDCSTVAAFLWPEMNRNTVGSGSRKLKI